jgi:glycine cleavage system H protein
MGMTDPAQTRSGKVLHVLFKKPGRHLEAGQSAATIETAKWAGPFPTPVAGTIAETNEATFRADILIANRDPYGAGWMVRLAPDEWSPEAAGLLTGEVAVSRYEARVDELDLNCFRCAD